MILSFLPGNEAQSSRLAPGPGFVLELFIGLLRVRWQMKLFLVRHGVAVDGIGGEIKSDAQRPLTPDGRDEVEQVAKGLRRSGIRLNHLVSSPLVRARQTAAVFADEFGMAVEICDALAPGGDTQYLYAFLKGKKGDSIALFGHEPDMSDLAQELLGVEFKIPFKKAGVCRIDVEDMPPRSPGTLKWFLPPKLSKQLHR